MERRTEAFRFPFSVVDENPRVVKSFGRFLLRIVSAVMKKPKTERQTTHVIIRKMKVTKFEYLQAFFSKRKFAVTFKKKEEE